MLLIAGAQDIGQLFRYILVPVPVVLTSLVVFNLYCWKWKWLNPWFSKRPVLIGTWRGELKTSWIDPETKEHPPAIKCFAVVRQTFTMLSIRLYTEESKSYLIAERLLREPDGIYKIACVYQNEPDTELRGKRSEIHFGAMILSVEINDRMSGHYWTDRETKGKISLSHISNELASSFENGETIEQGVAA